MGSFENDPLQTILIVVLFGLSLLIALCTALVFLYGIYFLLTLPMRRNERARIFLDLLELMAERGLRQMQPFARAGERAFIDDRGDELKMPDFKNHF